MPALAVQCNFSDLDPAFCIAGVAYSHFFSATGGTPPYNFVMSNWPTGVSLLGMPNNGDCDPNTGELFGVGSFSNPPWSPGDTAHDYVFLLFVTDSVGDTVWTSCNFAVYLTRSPIVAEVSFPVGTTGVAYSHAITITGGQSPYLVAQTGGSLPPGLTLNSDGTVTGVPTLNGLYTVFTSITGTGGGDNNASDFTFQIQIGGVGAQLGWQLYFFSYGVLGPLAISCGSPPDAVLGSPYSHAIPILPGGVAPYTYSIIAGALPVGLGISAATGQISGTPTVLGSSGFTVQVADSALTTASVECSITVQPALALGCNNPPSGAVGVPYDHSLSVTGGVSPYTLLIISGALPDGLSLNGSTGEISGTPTVGGTFNFTVKVTDSYTGNGSAGANTAQVSCSISIGSDFTVLCNDPPSGRVGRFYDHTFSAEGGDPPYTFAIVTGSLPPGLTLDASTGVVSGVPTLPGFYEFTVRVTDSNESSSQIDCSIRIKGCLLVDV